MAIWQFDLHILPRKSLESYFGIVPLSMNKDTFDQVEWWKNEMIPGNLEIELSKFLQRVSSWSKDIEMWGQEDGDRIDIVHENGKLVEIFIRIDVRIIPSTFLIQMIELSRKHDWLFLTQNNHVLFPSNKKVLSAIQRSDSFKFVQDPELFLSELEKEEIDSLNENIIQGTGKVH